MVGIRTFGIKDNTIRKRVLRAVEEKIKSAQTEFEGGVTVLEDQHKKEIDLANEKLETGKVALADKLVNSIIGKFI